MNLDIYSELRKLAKSSKYQTIYGSEKPLGLRIFKNEYDFTDIQITFLGYLSFYNQLNIDIVMGDVDEMVLKDTIFEDSYIYYKTRNRKKQRKEDKKKQEQVKKENPKKGEPKVDMKSQWIFRKPKGFSRKPKG